VSFDRPAIETCAPFDRRSVVWLVWPRGLQAEGGSAGAAPSEELALKRSLHLASPPDWFTNHDFDPEQKGDTMNTRRVQLTLATLSLLLFTPPVAAEDAPKLVEPLEVRAVVADGKHNAFTAFARWKDAYWLSFRKATSHGSGDGDLIVLRSPDAKKWEQVKRLDALPDDRDPQFLATEKRLFLYDPALKGGKLTSFVTFTEDGETWSEPQPVYKPTYIFWKPVAHEGRYYATAHVKSRDGKAREVHLIVSDDGLEWDKVSEIRGGNWESETTLLFDGDTLYAFLRQKYASPQSSILIAKPPYKQWKEKPTPRLHFSGHAAYRFDGVHYFLTRTFESGRKNPGVLIYTFKDGQLTPYCRLPAGGDCAYATAVQRGGEMLVAYYSSHEESTNIYLARVPLKGPAAGK